MRSGKFQSGCRAVTGDVKRLGSGYWRLEMRLGLVWGYGDAFGVESGPECWGGGEGGPPRFKRFPGRGCWNRKKVTSRVIPPPSREVLEWPYTIRGAPPQTKGTKAGHGRQHMEQSVTAAPVPSVNNL